jgi:hypothetical protein
MTSDRQPLVRVTRTTATLHPVGESHGRCRHSDATVHAARQLRASGASLRRVAASAGCSYSSAWRWTHGHRPEPVRIVVKRVHTPMGHRGQPPGTSNSAVGTATPVATPTDDFSNLA